MQFVITEKPDTRIPIRLVVGQDRLPKGPRLEVHDGTQWLEVLTIDDTGVIRLWDLHSHRLEQLGFKIGHGEDSRYTIRTGTA